MPGCACIWGVPRIQPNGPHLIRTPSTQGPRVGCLLLSYGPAALLSAIEPIVARFPGVKVALDHIGGAPTDEEAPAPLLGNVLHMAHYPNVYVKFSPQGHKSTQPFPFQDTFPAFEKLYDAFGPERLMWGTNFPGVVKGVGYGPAIELFRDHMEFLSPGDKEWLFAKTAQSIYEFGEK